MTILLNDNHKDLLNALKERLDEEIEEIYGKRISFALVVINKDLEATIDIGEAYATDGVPTPIDVLANVNPIGTQFILGQGLYQMTNAINEKD